MTRRFGKILEGARGDASLASFARRLGVSYTFARSMITGRRLPSDQVLEGLAKTLDFDYDRLLVAVYSDRSEALAQALQAHGVNPDRVHEEIQASSTGAPVNGNHVAKDDASPPDSAVRFGQA